MRDPNSIDACAREAERVYNQKTPPVTPTCAICGVPEDHLYIGFYNGICLDCLIDVYWSHEEEMLPFFKRCEGYDDWIECFGSRSAEEVWYTRVETWAWELLKQIAFNDFDYLADYFKERGWI